MSLAQTFCFHRNCPDCGKSIYVADSRVQRCAVCQGIKKMHHEERKIKKRFCKHCQEDITDYRWTLRICSECDKIPLNKRNLRSVPANHNEKARAITLYAVRIGFLPPPTIHKCTDCGRPAECYDHRDYTKPLEVEPVCIRCNTSRGKGIPLHLNH